MRTVHHHDIVGSPFARITVHYHDISQLQQEQLAVLSDLVAQTPDATLNELATQLQKKIGVEVGRTTLWRGLQQLDLSRKKRPKSRLKPIQ